MHRSQSVLECMHPSVGRRWRLAAEVSFSNPRDRAGILERNFRHNAENRSGVKWLGAASRPPILHPTGQCTLQTKVVSTFKTAGIQRQGKAKAEGMCSQLPTCRSGCQSYCCQSTWKLNSHFRGTNLDRAGHPRNDPAWASRSITLKDMRS